jgi:hypothetical protein
VRAERVAREKMGNGKNSSAGLESFSQHGSASPACGTPPWSSACVFTSTGFMTLSAARPSPSPTRGPAWCAFSNQLRARSEIASLRPTVVERHYLQSSLLQHFHIRTVFTCDR